MTREREVRFQKSSQTRRNCGWKGGIVDASEEIKEGSRQKESR